MAVPTLAQQVLQLTMKHQLHGNAVWNRFHFITDTPVLPADLDDVAFDAGTQWGTSVLLTFSNELTLPEVTCQQIWPTVGVLASSGPLTVSGGVAEQAVANQSAMVVTLATLDPGRRARGRCFLGGVTEATFDGGNGVFSAVVTATVAAGVYGWADSAWANSRGLEPVIWSTGSVVGPSPQYYPVFTTIGRVIPGSLRSRRLGRGI